MKKVIIIIIGIQGQSIRLRAALLSTGDWLNDVDGDNIPGRAGIDYPVHATVPEGTSFRCSDYDYAGYFGDVEAGCQAYHVCFPDGRNASFLCVNGTVFHQRFFVCDWWFHFECGKAPNMYELNLFRKIPLPVLGPPPRRPFPGPAPQPKIDLSPLSPRPPQQRDPKSLVLNSVDNDPQNRNPSEKQKSNPNDRQNEKDKRPKDTRKPQPWNPNPENKYKNLFDRGNVGEKDNACNCQCNA
ncbi:hypothetical protein CDAR_87051 [Caerostris darwini]|uniref:Chitin-binding type-2 domain-containing protein n=1 Tax=Caerostris darwini TaxID=1538125 RepID=A0AAV4U7Z5_9ARAC|nr:hypothetical protein CDAR_87051 [Caerostris darwini]